MGFGGPVGVPVAADVGPTFGGAERTTRVERQLGIQRVEDSERCCGVLEQFPEEGYCSPGG